MSTKLDDLQMHAAAPPGERANVRWNAGSAQADDIRGARAADDRMSCIPAIDPIDHEEGRFWLALATL